MWRRVVLARTDVSKECVASIFRVERIRAEGTTLAVTSILNQIHPNLSHPEDGGDTFLRNVCSNNTHTARRHITEDGHSS
jgi:hypothetical protein